MAKEQAAICSEGAEEIDGEAGMVSQARTLRSSVNQKSWSKSEGPGDGATHPKVLFL